MTEKVTIEREGNIAWVVINNPPVNATSTAVRAGLLSAVAEVQGARLAVLRCEGRTFIAGGDMSEFDAPAQPPHLPDVVQAIEDSDVPFLALLHGTVLGGGFEIAMGCAWRIAAPGTRFGLPEVNVGLIPGAGGTQRLPRLIGLEPAIDVACAGRLLDADELLGLGGLDAIEDDLIAAARAFAADLPVRPRALSKRLPVSIDPALISERRATLARQARGAQAPLMNLEALQWAALPFAEGQQKERERHLAMRQSAESRALRHAFFAERQVARPGAISGRTPRDIGLVAVVGGGLMGAGIAAALLSADIPVTLIERDAESAQAGADRVRGLLEAGVKRGKISPDTFAARMGQLSASDEFAAAAGADLAIEAVFEDVEIKRAVFSELAAVMDRDALLATNTSYLDPREIFAGLPGSDRCLGLHFFSPAHVMKLLEVVRLPDTSAEVLATAFALGRRMRKVSVLAGICDGFIGNRMLAAYRREADYLLADGALPHQIDDAMRSFGMPMGPYEMQDMSGLQIAWANRKRQAATRDPNERYVTIADQLCEMGRLGQRTGKGWYRYETGSRKPVRDPEVENLIEAYSAAQGIARQPFEPGEIAARLLAVLANEGALIVAQGIAENAAAVDMVQIHGYGFPRWRGGPMHHAAEIGWQATGEAMARVAAQSPGSWTIADTVRAGGTT